MQQIELGMEGKLQKQLHAKFARAELPAEPAQSGFVRGVWCTKGQLLGKLVGEFAPDSVLLGSVDADLFAVQ